MKTRHFIARFCMLAVLVATVTLSGMVCPNPTPPPPPNAVAPSPIDANEGERVTLNGAGSDGSNISFSWSQTSGPSVALSGSVTSTATFTAPRVTSNVDLIFRLTVTDDRGRTADASVTVRVKDRPPIAQAGPDQNVHGGESVALSASASSGDELRFQWSQTAGPSVTLSGAQTSAASFTAPTVTSDTALTFSVRVTDRDGQTAEDSVTVTVSPAGGGGGTGAVVSGHISVNATRSDVILEAEPNDSPDRAHNLGTLRDGQTIVVLGHITSDGTDPFDGFHVTAAERLRITATLDFDNVAGNDLDMFVYDDSAMVIAELFNKTTVPEIGEFHAKGSFDFVIMPFAGVSQYRLKLEAHRAADPIAEKEPNDDVTSSTNGQFVGKLLPGERVRVSGDADSVLDRDDIVLVACPQAVVLKATLAFPAGADYDIIVYGATNGRSSATEIGRFESTTANPETGALDVAGMSMIGVATHVFAGSGPYTLTLEALTAGSPHMATTIAPIETELANPTKSYGPARYGRLKHPFVAGQAIVRGQSGADAHASLQPYACGVESEIPGGACCACFALPDGMSDADKARRTYAVVRQLCHCEAFRYAEPNGICQATAVPNDPMFNLQWHYQIINMPAAWDITKGSDSIIVAVIDTGIFNHPDLQGRIISGFDMISNPNISRDGDGPDADPTDPGDLGGPNGTSSWHGTHVAGTIGAVTNNGSGVAGMTWMTKIMPVRVLGRGGGTNMDIANGILCAAGLTNGSGLKAPTRANVINMSLGGPGQSQLLADAVAAARAAGVVIVAAAGNENSSEFFSPAGLPGVFAVSAVDLNRHKAPYSNFGTAVDIAAPGGDTSVDRNGDGHPDGVLSTLVDESTGQKRPAYQFYQGTSMACPHVAGLAALVLGVNPNLSPDDVERIIRETAEDLGAPGRDDIFGFGLINAAAAVLRAQGNSNSPPRLGLARQSINFGSTESAISVGVMNLGGGTLSITSVTPSTQSGGPWLSAALNGGGTAIDVSINRAGLAAGAYSGAVDVRSNGGNSTIQVVMQAPGGTTPPPGRQYQIFILAINVDTNQTVDQVAVTTVSGESVPYAFNTLPPGRYIIFAGTDDDMDNFICDDGELCGAFPVSSEPTVIEVTASQGRNDVDFVVSEVSSSSAAPGTTPPDTMQKLRKW